MGKTKAKSFLGAAKLGGSWSGIWRNSKWMYADEDDPSEREQRNTQEGQGGMSGMMSQVD